MVGVIDKMEIGHVDVGLGMRVRGAVVAPLVRYRKMRVVVLMLCMLVYSRAWR